MVSLSQGKWTPQATSSKSEQRKVKKQNYISVQKGRRWVQLELQPQVPQASFPHAQNLKFLDYMPSPASQ